MKVTKQQVEEFFETQLAKDIMTVAAFGIDKTPTEKDNEVIANAGDYAELIGEKLSEVEALDPTEKETVDAGIRILQTIAAQTKTKWDDFIVGLAAKLTGANKEKNL